MEFEVKIKARQSIHPDNNLKSQMAVHSSNLFAVFSDENADNDVDGESDTNAGGSMNVSKTRNQCMCSLTSSSHVQNTHDDLYEEKCSGDEVDASRSSEQSADTNDTTNASTTQNQYELRNESIGEEEIKQPNILFEPISTYRKKISCLHIIIFTALVFIFLALYMRDNTPRCTQCSFEELKKKYTKEKDYLWNHLQSANDDILCGKSDKPAVFLFVNQNKEKAKSLINDIANTSSGCLGKYFSLQGSSPIIEHIDFSSEEALKDYGYVIDQYKKTVKEGNVILIANVNEIPGEVAKALHTICDTVTFMVKKVIILLSLTVEQIGSNERVIDVAENALKKLWQDKMEPNELEPLITRVTDQVLLLQSN